MSARPRFNATEPQVPKGKLTLHTLKELQGLFKYIKPYRTKFILGMLFLALSSASSLAFPAVIGKLVDSALKDGGPQMLARIDTYAQLLVLILIAQAVFSFFRVAWFVEVGERSLADLRKDLFNRLVQMPMNFFGQRRVGELTSRISSDISQIQDTFTGTLSEILRGVATLIVGITIIFYTSTKLALVMLSSFPVVIVVAIYFGRYIRKLARQSSDRLAEAGVMVEETLQGIQNVKAYTNEWFEFSRYQTAIGKLIAVALKSAKYRGAFISFIIAALFGSIVLVLWYGSRMVGLGEITAGELITFLFYTAFVGGAVGGFGDQYAQLLRAIGATERVRELLREPTEMLQLSSEAQAQPKTRVEGAVSFDNVGFVYPSRPEVQVLKGLSFEAKPGEKIAIVGPSGAGKSTLVSLLLRFYDPDSGTILIDGKPAMDYPLSEFRGQMALVPQEVILFGGTIRENIAYGKLDATEAEIIAAAEQANAYNFILGFPDGLGTVVGERGVKLSGGQRQRIAIARAVLRDPAILILDEATSSLDSESERLVQQALEKLMEGRTTFIVAHRLATIRNADQILVLQNGHVVEHGRHSELIQLEGGLYQMLAKLQFTGAVLQV